MSWGMNSLMWRHLIARHRCALSQADKIPTRKHFHTWLWFYIIKNIIYSRDVFMCSWHIWAKYKVLIIQPTCTSLVQRDNFPNRTQFLFKSYSKWVYTTVHGIWYIFSTKVFRNGNVARTVLLNREAYSVDTFHKLWHNLINCHGRAKAIETFIRI